MIQEALISSDLQQGVQGHVLLNRVPRAVHHDHLQLHCSVEDGSVVVQLIEGLEVRSVCQITTLCSDLDQP